MIKYLIYNRGNYIKIHSSESNFSNLKPLKILLIGNNEIISETDYNTPFEVISNIDIIIIEQIISEKTIIFLFLLAIILFFTSGEKQENII